MPRPPSAADIDFDARLKALGLPNTPRKVQAFRESGLLEPPAPQYPGGGGSSARYPGEAVQRMREALDLDAKYPRYLAVAAMFVRRRHPVAETKLRHALLQCMTRAKASLSRAGQAPEDAQEGASAMITAEALARRVMREPDADPMRRRIKRQPGRSREDVIVEIMNGIIEVANDGSAPSPDTLGHLAHYAGVAAIAGPKLTAEILNQADPSDFQAMTFSNVREAIATATMAQLERARDDAREFQLLINSMPAFFELIREGNVGPQSIARTDIDDTTLVWQTVYGLGRLHLDSAGYGRVAKTSREINVLLQLIRYLPPDLRAIYLHELRGEPAPTLSDEQQQRHDRLLADFKDKRAAETAPDSV
jgi:hypothetical protein